ncbi:MAG: hypothetical protein AAFV43_13710, partial [Planctomycetota bacterium]
MSSESPAKPEESPTPASSEAVGVATPEQPESASPTTPSATAPAVAELGNADPSSVEPGNAPPDAAAATPPASPDATIAPVAEADRPSERIKVGSSRSGGVEQAAALKPKPVNPVTEGEAPQDTKNYPPPNVRAQLSEEQEAEFEALMKDSAAEAVMDAAAAPVELPAETKLKGKVLQVTFDSVIVDLGENRQGVVPLKQFETKGLKGQPQPAAAEP